MKTIEEEWQGFAEMVLAGVNPSPVQVEEMKRSFFAGAFMMLMAINRIGEPDISEEQGILYLEDRKREGEAFYKDLIKKYSETN